MAYLNDFYRNAGLTQLATDGTRLDLCSTEPTTYTQATSTYTLSNKTGVTMTVEDIPTNAGRRAVIPVQTGMTQTGTAGAVAGFWALTDPGNSRLIATGALASTVTILGSPNTMSTLAAIYIKMPLAVAG